VRQHASRHQHYPSSSQATTQHHLSAATLVYQSKYLSISASQHHLSASHSAISASSAISISASQ